MKHQVLLIVVSASVLDACAHNPFHRGADVGTRTAVGAGVGAAIGAAAGTAIGADPITGAAAGMVAGGAIGALVKGPIIKDRQYYRDSRGYCYYVDAKGNPKYARGVKC